MKGQLFSFTKAGTALNERLVIFLQRQHWQVVGKSYAKHIASSSIVQPLQQALTEEVVQAFTKCQCLIFIGAAGIAVRLIAPLLRSKVTDPAVLVIDEKGHFVIPLVSGHIGGANGFAEKIAAFLGGEAVLTTATDVNQLFAVDAFAAQKGLCITSMLDAKRFAATILETKQAGLYSDFPITGALPPSLKKASTGVVGVAVSLRDDCRPFQQTVTLQPPIFHLGLGCRAGIEEEAVADAVTEALSMAAVQLDAVCAVHSIEIKAKEEGILSYCARHHLPYTTFDAATLNALPGCFTASSFVRRTVGVDNVCERAAAAGSHGGTILLRKQALHGVTVAIAYENYTLSFP